MTVQVFETDWLGSVPVFYNEQTGRVGCNINDVIDYANLEFDPDGFNHYLDFGYSVFEQTPVKYVKFLRHSSRLTVDSSGSVSVEYLNDPIDTWLQRRLSEQDVLDLLHVKINDWERTCSGEIIIPTSGGYDSRLLNLLIADKTRVRSFSYGASERQEDSFEVVYARQLAQILGTRWEQITIGDSHLYFDDWNKLFGVATHAHGMYHLEFYNKILHRVSGGNPLLSGIIGDAWAGSVEIPPLERPEHVKRLGYTHGLNADSSMSLFPNKYAGREQYFVDHNERLQDFRVRVVEAMRFKIILLSYLMIVPHSLGFKPWSPFLDIEVAMAMLNLPPERRKLRIWQQEVFQKHGLDFERMNLRISKQNTFNYQAMRRVALKPLDVTLLAEVVRPAYVEWVNRIVKQVNACKNWSWKLFYIPKVGTVMRKLGLKEQQLAAYCAYLILKPIEILLTKRNMCS